MKMQKTTMALLGALLVTTLTTGCTQKIDPADMSRIEGAASKAEAAANKAEAAAKSAADAAARAQAAADKAEAIFAKRMKK
jgi:hypothetical protein